MRLILPALLASLVATAVSWIFLPDMPTYHLPAASVMIWALLFGPVAGVMSVALMRSVAWADKNKPGGWRRIAFPILMLAIIGVVATQYPQILDNRKDISQLTFAGGAAPMLLALH